MKFLFFILMAISLSAVDYSTLYKSHGKGYENSNVYISGEYASHSCSENNKRSIDNYCQVRLNIFENGTHMYTVYAKVGTTYKSDFESAFDGKTFSFSCIYEGSLYNFDCR